ncbi:MAG: hypothetical protein ACFFD1_02530, partial [Candidatus Thorarchaeota archaeon]
REIYLERKNKDFEYLFDRIYRLIPFIINQNLNLIIQDSDSKDILFNHKSIEISASTQSELLRTFIPFQEPNVLFAEAKLNEETVYLILGNICVAHFALTNYLITLISERSKQNNNRLFEVTSTFKERIIQYFKEYDESEKDLFSLEVKSSPN